MAKFVIGLVTAVVSTPILHHWSPEFFHAALSWGTSALGGVVLGFGGWLSWLMFVDDVEGGDWW